jgi:hypothetical protein
MRRKVQVILTLSVIEVMDKKDIERHILKYLENSVEVLKIEIKEAEIYRSK